MSRETFLRASSVPTKKKYGRVGATSTGRKPAAAARGTAVTRSGSKWKRSMAARRTASLGVITIPANPRRNSRGVRRRTRADSGREYIQGERSCSVITLGRRGRYGTEKSVPWKRSTPRRDISRSSPHSHHLRPARVRGLSPQCKLSGNEMGRGNIWSERSQYWSSGNSAARAVANSKV